MTTLKRKLFCHTSDGVPVYRTRKGGRSGYWLTCWFGLEPTQPLDDDGGPDAFDARRLEACPGNGFGHYYEEDFRAALEQATSAELRSLISTPSVA